MKVHEKVDDEQRWSEMGQPPITLRRVDANKGSNAAPFTRSRLEVREWKAKTPDLTTAELCLAMPTLGAFMVLLSLLSAKEIDAEGGDLKMGFLGTLNAASSFAFRPKNTKMDGAVCF